jgi:hypothetical protein
MHVKNERIESDPVGKTVLASAQEERVLLEGLGSRGWRKWFLPHLFYTEATNVSTDVPFRII